MTTLRRSKRKRKWKNSEAVDNEYINSLLENPESLKNIMIDGIISVLDDDAPCADIIERNVNMYIRNSNRPLSYQSGRLIQQLEQEIEEEKPTLDKIAVSNLSTQDKKYCLKLYKVFSNTDPLSEDYIRLEQYLIDKLKYNTGASTEKTQELEQIEINLHRKIASLHTLKERILKLETDEPNKCIIYKKYLDFEMLSPTDSNYQILKEWLEWAVKIPFGKKSLISDFRIKNFLKETKEVFDRKIYGMKKVKEEFLIFIHNLYVKADTSKNLLLEGNPGTGKTLVAQACAEALKWPFYRVSCGGLNDSSFLKGQNTVWIGSSPSIFVKALCIMECKNGILLLDEIDKMDRKSQEALLDIIDRTTNKKWRDGFLIELSIDIGGLLIIATANKKSRIIKPLLDRFERIYIPSYEKNEKHIILKNYVLNEILQCRHLFQNSITLNDFAINYILSLEKNGGGGVRETKEILSNIIAKIHLLHNLGEDSKELNLKFNPKFLSFPINLTVQDIKSL